MAQQSHHPRLVFLPYLPLQASVEFAGWWLGPLDEFEGSWVGPRFEELCRTFLAAFRDPAGEQLPRPSLLARSPAGAGAKAPDDREYPALQRAIHLVVLDGNEPWKPNGPNEGWKTATSDNSELFVWPIDVEAGWVAIRQGAMVTTEIGGLRIDDGLTIAAPLELSLPRPRRLDVELLEAAYHVFASRDGEHAKLARRLGGAVDWLARAWRNTPSIHVEDRLVLIKTGFEALTGKSQTYATGRCLRQLFEQLRDEGVADNDVQHLLWSSSERPVHAHYYQKHGQQRKTLLSDLEHWFDAFGHARNQIIHEGRTSLLFYDGPASAYHGPMLWTAERLLKEAIKIAMGQFGYRHLWQSEFARLLRRKFHEAGWYS